MQTVVMETNKIPGSRALSGIPGQPFSRRIAVGECFINWTYETSFSCALPKRGFYAKSGKGEDNKSAVRKKAQSRNAGCGVCRAGETRQETRGFYGNRETLVEIPKTQYVSGKSCFVFDGLIRKSALVGYRTRHHDQIPRIGVHRGRYAQDLPPAIRPGKSVFQGIGGIHLEVFAGGLAKYFANASTVATRGFFTRPCATFVSVWYDTPLSIEISRHLPFAASSFLTTYRSEYVSIERILSRFWLGRQASSGLPEKIYSCDG